MTTEAQRIAIAEACGYINVSVARGECYGFKTGVRGILRPPDYLGDLNAMHEAEKTAIFSKGNGMVYLSILDSVVAGSSFYEYEGVRLQRWFACATGSQRAEALLKAIGKWIDSPQ